MDKYNDNFSLKILWFNIEYFQTEIIIVFSYEHLLHVLHP